MTFVFDPDEAPTLACHAPTIVALADRLVAAWFAGTHEKHPDVGIWTATWSNGWGPPRQVADGAGEACWNPVLFDTPDGLRLFYKVGASPGTWRGEVLTSHDAGETWRTGPHLPDGFLGPIKNKPLALDNGDLLCPSSREQGGWTCHFEILPADARAEARAHAVPDPVGFGAIQPTVFRRGGGYEALVRTKRGVIARTTSADGRHWAPLEATPLPNPNSGIDAANLADGRVALVYNPASTPDGRWGGPRTTLALAVSGDDGEWRHVATLEDATDETHGSGAEFSYPAIVCADKLHIVYTWQRRSIKHVSLEPGLI